MERRPNHSPTMTLSTRSWCFTPTQTTNDLSHVWWTVRCLYFIEVHLEGKKATVRSASTVISDKKHSHALV